MNVEVVFMGCVITLRVIICWLDTFTSVLRANASTVGSIDMRGAFKDHITWRRCFWM